MNRYRFGFRGLLTLVAGVAFLGASAGGVQAGLTLPAWMTDTANGTIAFPGPMTAGSHSADSTGTTFGDATFTLNSGSFDNWLMSGGATLESVPSGSPLDMTYGSDRTVDLSVLAPDTLRIVDNSGFGATGPNFGQGDDRVTQSQYLRIAAQSDITIEITYVGALCSGSAGAGSGGYTFVSGEGGFYEDGNQVSPLWEGTYNLSTGSVYDLYSISTIDIHENAEGRNGAGFGESCETTFDIRIVPEPASLSLLALGGLAVIRRRR